MKKIYFLLGLLLLSACASKAPEIDGFKRQTYLGKDNFFLSGQEKNLKMGEKLRVYFDGNATTGGLFTKRAVLEHPVAAQLAQKDKAESILYLDRPCYFSDDDRCKPITWEEGKYAPEIVDQIVFALWNIAQKYHIPEFELIGYDGGGAVALLVATRLSNKQIKVSKVVTIAGILDTEQYALLHDEKLFEYSLNPAREAYTVANIPQLHIIGKKDKQISETMAKLFSKKLLDPVSFVVKAYDSADHYNWARFKMEY